MAAFQQTSLVLETKRGPLVLQDRPVPAPGHGELLVKVLSAGLNNVDWKIQTRGLDYIEYPGVLGSDGSGTVETLGDGVARFQKGDKVLWEPAWAFVSGAYQQYAIVKADLAAKVPENLTLDEAASVPMSLCTAFLGLYNRRSAVWGGGAGLIPFWETPSAYSAMPFMVLGGSSSVGEYAIQFARLSGFSPIIATASDRHVEHLKSIGATHVLSRSASVESLLAEVHSITDEPLQVVYDSISTPETQQAGWKLLAPGGQLVVTLAPVAGLPNDESKGFAWVKGNVNFPDQIDIGRQLFARLTGLLADGSIKPHRIRVISGGLSGIEGGLKLLQDGKVSGAKLIVHPQEGL
ncbi:GroES-like protein [Punctularia strigosozonata HHB-11173 SS5]|uniref:GroES-like protein n=1 Tax=Punctularia strigosozonata (strain HHB-11173) TaxID=741275 RepID=UPI0004416807|nr:GroES-like protein [Punctularia strigosozonata HHB-11173 SS5]EIN12987.1 GroES-like protein [Punctularia strigosozonata HHB-11173 SS5]